MIVNNLLLRDAPLIFYFRAQAFIELSHFVFLGFEFRVDFENVFR